MIAFTPDPFFESVGGRPIVQNYGAAGPDGELYAGAYDFGLIEAHNMAIGVKPSMYLPAPSDVLRFTAQNTSDKLNFQNMSRGKWDGSSPFSLYQRFEKAFGTKMKAQKQKRGTCVSRAGSGAFNILQGIAALNGRSIVYNPVSHSAFYGFGREAGNMLGRGDGMVGSYAAAGARKFGQLTQTEVGDNYYDDEIAYKFGLQGVPDNLRPLAADNLLREASIVRNTRDAADLIWNGCPLVVCSGRGFTMSRNSNGVCDPSGVWYHGMVVGSIAFISQEGGLCFGIGQSWGDNVPSGPVFNGDPDFVFGAREKTFQSMLDAEDTTAYCAFDLWIASKPDWYA